MRGSSRSLQRPAGKSCNKSLALYSSGLLDSPKTNLPMTRPSAIKPPLCSKLADIWTDVILKNSLKGVRRQRSGYLPKLHKGSDQWKGGTAKIWALSFLFLLWCKGVLCTDTHQQFTSYHHLKQPMWKLAKCICKNNPLFHWGLGVKPLMLCSREVFWKFKASQMMRY